MGKMFVMKLGNYLLIAPEPPEGQKIIGFYGRSKWPEGWMEVDEFGIITAPTEVELPMALYDMTELQNTDGGMHEY